MAIRFCESLRAGQIREMHQIYNQSFERIRTGEDRFRERLGLEGPVCALMEERQGAVMGYALVRGNCLQLLAVRREARGKGLGSALLTAAEEKMRVGANRLLLGSGAGGYLVPGVPMEPENDASEWLARRGYAPGWISLDMVIKLSEAPSFEPVRGIDIRWRNERDPGEVLRSAECAETIVPGWGKFYQQPGQRALLALDGERIVGVNLVDQTLGGLYSQSLPRAAGFGCLGVRESHRERGIGRALCLSAMEALKALGAGECFIGYTYLEDWYGKLGAKKYMEYWMGEKRLD